MALQPKVKRDLTELEEKYLDILVDEYFGYIPHGEHRGIADRLGCDVQDIYKMNSAKNKFFTAEKERRLAQKLPLGDKMTRIAALQLLFEDKIEKRKASGLALTGKDPLEILEQIRKESNATSPNQGLPTSVIFQFVQNLSDSELSERMMQIEEALRTGNFVKEKEIIDGEWTDASGDGSSIGGDEGGKGTALLQSGP